VGKLELVHGRARNWTDEQMRIVNEGIEATQSTVPTLEGTFDSFLVLDGDTPVGLVSIIPTSNPEAVEVGVRFWTRNNVAGRVMARGLQDLFTRFNYIIARCYANNMIVRRLVQRAGFILLGTYREHGRSLHVYGCRKTDFERVAPKGVLRNG